VLQKNGIHSLLPRHVNQDPLECFFGAARSVSSSNPSCNAFASAYKTLLLNNLMSPNSHGSNCEDMVEASLTSYKHLFQINPDELVKVNNQVTSVDLPVTIYNPTVAINDIRGQVQTYIAGYILKRLNKNIFKNCHNCLQNLCVDNISSEHNIILAREYTSRLSLKYPSTSFSSLVQQIITYIGQQISKICHHTNICKTLSTDIKNNFTFNSLSLCNNHGKNLEKRIIDTIVNLMVNHWCTEVNRILLGKKKFISWKLTQ